MILSRSFGRLAEYYSEDWRNIVSDVGKISVGRLVKITALYCAVSPATMISRGTVIQSSIKN